MSSFRRLVPALALLLIGGLSSPRPATAWGPVAHKVICAIAYKLVTQQERDRIDALIASYRTPDGWTYRRFTSSCSFADLARAKARDERPGWTRFDVYRDWHFLNVPRDTRKITSSNAARFCDGRCVLSAIEEHRSRLADPEQSRVRRAEALMLLSHWVGDVHQPLHVSYADDRGGNAIDGIRGGYYRSDNLHAVWDSGIIGKTSASKDWWKWAGSLAAQVTPAERATWTRKGPVDWAAESYAITTEASVDYCEWQADECEGEGRVRTLGPRYQKRFAATVEQRLKQAGVRLADVLRKALGGS
jgi:hypothetical protein